MNIAALAAEITNDPLARGYSGMSHAQVAASLNTANRTRERATLSASEIFEAITPAEYDALTNGLKAGIDRILHLGDSIRIGTGTKARAIMLAAFGAGTATRAALIAAAGEPISRATELGLSVVGDGHVQSARAQ